MASALAGSAWCAVIEGVVLENKTGKPLARAKVHLDSVKDGSGLKKAAFGAAGVVALRVGLRYALSGPLGMVLTGAAAISAVTYLVKNQKEIGTKVGIYKAQVADARTKFDEIQGGFRAGRYDAAARNLMVDGLLHRFLEDIDAA